VCSTNEVHVVADEELVYDCLSEAVTDTTFVVFPVHGSVGGIRPKKVVEKSKVGNISRALYTLDVVHSMERRRKSAMDTENFRCYNGGDGETVEYIDEGLPSLDVTSSFAFVVEAID